MDSNYYELDQLITLHGSHPLHDKYSAIDMNIRSLPEKCIILKPFPARLVESKIKFDFILLYEILTNNNFDLYNIARYNLVCRNRKHMKVGGVDMYVSDRYEYVVREDLSLFEEHIFLEIINVRNKILIGEVYRDPNANCQESIAKYDPLWNRINDENVDLIIGTDQNIKYLNIDTNHATDMFNRFLSVWMVPTISRPTRITYTSATLVDNVYVRINKLDETLSGILSIDLSDHLPLFIDMGSKNKRKPKSRTFKYRKLDENTFKNIKTFLCVTDWSCLNNIDIEES